jgi:uncharacterized coiled-coil protein SlyX
MTLEERIAQLETLTRLQQRMLNESVNQIANAWLAIHQLAAMIVGANDQLPGEQPLDDGVAPRH